VNEIKGFIKLYRSLLDWEWFNDANTLRLFIYCLLKANYSDTKWRGIDIERGSFVTSYNQLSLNIGISVQQVRTSLTKLISTGEITFKSHSKYSIISINNYDDFQENNTQNNKQMTNKQQTNNKQITTDKENKNNKEKKEKKNRYKDHVLLTQLEYDSLITEFGEDRIESFIFRLDEYIGMTGKKYTNHNLVLRNWMRKDPNPSWLSELKQEQSVADSKEHVVVDLEKVKRFNDL